MNKLSMKPTGSKLSREIETLLREAGIPYISVDEAKRALFAGAKLTSFHFAVYFPEGVNWLLQCGERTRDRRRDMAEWQTIFGDGFRSVFAVRRKGGIRFSDPEGRPLFLPGDKSAWLAHAPIELTANTSKKPPAFGSQIELFSEAA